MSEEAEQNLQNYRLQLQQVEAALELDKDNKELTTLKAELEEIIALTLQLLGKDATDLEAADSLGWKVGDHCMALWPKDKQYHAGVLTEIGQDGHCTVKFSHAAGEPEQCEIGLLKPMPSSTSSTATASSAGSDGAAAAAAAGSDAEALTAQGSYPQAAKKRKREERAKAQELKAKKNARREERQKEMEATVEQEKRSWLNFSKKMGKQKKMGKSIFATPDPEHSTGRVGVGTCGISGRGMTPFALPQYRPQGQQQQQHVTPAQALAAAAAAAAAAAIAAKSQQAPNS